jgi:ribonuclease HI
LFCALSRGLIYISNANPACSCVYICKFQFCPIHPPPLGDYQEETNKDAEVWTVFCDGSWGTFEAGAAAVLVAPSKVKTCYATRLDFSCTNNIAEYEALLLGLRKLKAMGIRRAVLKIDSQVISGHIDKSYKARDPNLEKYLDTVRRIEASFEGFSVKNIPRGDNEYADLLAKSAA